MKKYLFGFLATLTSSLLADSFSGAVWLKDKKMDEIKVFGAADVESVTAKKVDVNGALRAKKLTVDEGVAVHGAVTVSETVVKGNVEVSGGLEAIGSTLQDVSIAGAASLVDTTAKSVRFTGTEGEQKLRLSGKTEVAGDVVFDNGKGEVLLEKGAVVKGQVKGGKVVTTN